MVAALARDETTERGDVGVRIDMHRCATQAGAIDQRRVIQLVREDHVGTADQRRDDAGIRGIAAGEDSAASVPKNSASACSSF